MFDQADLELATRLFPRLRSIAGHNLVNPLSLRARDAFCMTFVREPVERVFSHYQAMSQSSDRPISFEEALRSNELLENLQVKLIAGCKDLEQARRCVERFAFVGLTEQFDLSLHLLRRLGPRLLNLNYKRKRVATDNTIRQSLQRDTRLTEMARESNDLDLELYRFVVEEAFPALCEKAGIKPSAQATSYENYASEMKLIRVVCRLYNKLVYRQICKLIAPPERPRRPKTQMGEVRAVNTMSLPEKRDAGV